MHAWLSILNMITKANQSFSATELVLSLAVHITILVWLLLTFQPWWAFLGFAAVLKAKEVFMFKVYGLETMAGLDY